MTTADPTDEARAPRYGARRARSPRRPRALVKSLGLLFASVLVAALLAEIGLRAFGLSYPASLYTGDRDTGWALRPGAEGYEIGETTQYITISSAGLRDREHAPAKAAGALRIAVLGDSFSAALQVPQDSAYWAVMGDRLGACPALANREVEVINFGVDGFGQGHELAMFRSRVAAQHPDVVLLQVYLGNDVLNNSKALNEGAQPAVPYFFFQGESLVLDDSFRRLPNLDPAHIERANLFSDLVNRSRLGLLLYSAHQSFGRRARVAPLDAEALDPGPKERPLFTEPTRPELVEAWRITEGLFSMLDAEVRSSGARLWIATLSMPVQVFPDVARRAAVQETLGVTDLYYPDRRVHDYAVAHGIPVVTLAPELAAHADRTGAYLHGFPTSVMGTGHWNEEGHRVGGELIATAMCGAFSAEATP